MQGIDGHIWGWGEGGGQVYLGRVRLGEHRGLVAGGGGGEAGVVHGAAHGMDSFAYKTLIGQHRFHLWSPEFQSFVDTDEEMRKEKQK